MAFKKILNYAYNIFVIIVLIICIYSIQDKEEEIKCNGDVNYFENKDYETLKLTSLCSEGQELLFWRYYNETIGFSNKL